MLADVGVDTLKQLRECSVSDQTIRTLASRIEEELQREPGRLIAGSSLGLTFSLQTDRGRYQARSPIERGRLTNETLREAIEIAVHFDTACKNSPKFNEFMAAYETAEGVPTKNVIGYLAAFPIANQMKKEGHF